MIVVVQAIPGREDLTAATLRQLDDVGGAATLPDNVPRVLYWSGREPPPFVTPSRWIVVHDSMGPRGHRHDLWRLLDIVGDQDVALFEDDIVACRNAVPYIVTAPADLLTTFCKLKRVKEGIYPANDFQGSMALKIPARLVVKLRDAGPDGNGFRYYSLHGGDTRINHLLTMWGERVRWHRSLVQHVGVVSLCNPGATLTGPRAMVPDFDVNFDPTVST